MPVCHVECGLGPETLTGNSGGRKKGWTHRHMYRKWGVLSDSVAPTTEPPGLFTLYNTAGGVEWSP